jgi:hypothetical protein
MQETVEIGDLYRIALAHGVQIRRLNFKRDSLEDIFLKAMENGNMRDGTSVSINNGNAVENANGNGGTSNGSL